MLVVLDGGEVAGATARCRGRAARQHRARPGRHRAAATAGRWRSARRHGRRGRPPTGATRSAALGRPDRLDPGAGGQALARQLAPYRLSPHVDRARRPPARGHGAARAARARRRGRGRPRADLAPARAAGTGCGCRSASARTAAPSSWTSRSPRRTAWARTACSSAPPAPASPSCCARWCSALAATHSSEDLNFVLVDFKGGATFASLDALPHTSAVITNLADELPWSTGCRTRSTAS